MKTIGYVYTALICFFVIFFKWGDGPLSVDIFFVKPLLLIVYLTPVAILGHWPRHIKNYFIGNGKSKLPYSTIVGCIVDVKEHCTGKQKMFSVTDGYSSELTSGKTYVHYHYSYRPETDGYIATILTPEGRTVFLRTLPRSSDTFPSPDASRSIQLTYATDKDGTMYYCPGL